MVQIRSKGELRVKMKRTVSCVSVCVCVVGVCDFVCETLCEEGVQYREKRENFVNFQPKSVLCCLTIGDTNMMVKYLNSSYSRLVVFALHV